MHSCPSSLGQKTVKNKDIKIPAGLVQFLLALDGPSGGRAVIEIPADPTGQNAGIFVIVGHKIRLPDKVSQKVL